MASYVTKTHKKISHIKQLVYSSFQRSHHEIFIQNENSHGFQNPRLSIWSWNLNIYENLTQIPVVLFCSKLGIQKPWDIVQEGKAFEQHKLLYTHQQSTLYEHVKNKTIIVGFEE